MALKKVGGSILLILGLLIIFWVLYSSYNIFTAKTEVPEIFSTSAHPKADYDESAEAFGEGEKITEMMGEMMGEQLKGLLPSDFLPKLFNLIAWSIFAGLTIFGGTQISGLGIKLIK